MNLIFVFFKEVLVEIIGFQCLEECLKLSNWKRTEKELSSKKWCPCKHTNLVLPSALPCITKFVVWSNFWAQAWWTNKQCKRTPVWSFSWKFSVVGWSLSANYPVINTFCCFFSLKLLFAWLCLKLSVLYSDLEAGNIWVGSLPQVTYLRQLRRLWKVFWSIASFAATCTFHAANLFTLSSAYEC